MARRKAERPAERGVRRAETNARHRAPDAESAGTEPRQPRAATCIEEWLSEESSPIREVELIQRRLNIDAQLAEADQADRLGEL
jgi:hypothetical protein